MQAENLNTQNERIYAIDALRGFALAGIVLVHFAEQRSKTKKHAESWIAGTVGAAVLLTTHSIVAILTVAEFANSRA